MSIVQLDILLAYAAVEWQSCVCGSQPGRAGLLEALVQEEHLVQQSQQGEAECETDNGYEQPVVAQPENNLHVSPVPAVAEVVSEEAPGVVVVFVREEDAQAVGAFRALVHVVAPDETEVERASRCHDGDVRKWPATVVVGQRINGLEEEWVAGDCAHNVVGDTGGDSATDPGWVGKKRVEATIASLEYVSHGG